VIKGCNIFWVKNWQTLAALWAGAILCNMKVKVKVKSAVGSFTALQPYGLLHS
jgi:hypothetical protein